MDLYFDKKEIKKFKKLGMTDAEIEEMRIHKMKCCVEEYFSC